MLYSRYHNATSQGVPRAVAPESEPETNPAQATVSAPEKPKRSRKADETAQGATEPPEK